jgi:hypothetical protein
LLLLLDLDAASKILLPCSSVPVIRLAPVQRANASANTELYACPMCGTLFT